MSPTGARAAQALFVLVAMAVVVAFVGVVRDGEQRRAPETLVRLLNPAYVGENRLAPDFELSDREGRRHRLSALRGKVVVLHFLTRTCAPCVEELQHSLPVFDEIARDRPEIALVLVTVDRDWAAIAPLVPNGFSAPILFDPGRAVVAGRYGTRQYPETWVIDPDGVIRARFDGTLDWSSSLLVDYLLALRS